MGSDIQSLAILAKAYDSAMNYAVGLTSLEILYSHSISRPRLQTLSLLSLAARKLLLRDARCAGFQSLDSEGAAVIA